MESDSPYRLERKRMVKTQLKSRGIQDPGVLSAFLKVPRHKFVPGELLDQAYQDGPLPIGHNQTISQPYMVAVMVQQAAAGPGERVLEVGTGSGYQAAILAEMGSEVYTLERIPELAAQAETRLEHLGYGKINIRLSDGTLGWEEQAPFDAIIVAAAAPKIPDPLLGQLAEGGRLIIPLDDGPSQILSVIERTSEGFRKHQGERCTFVPLLGKHGWKKDPLVH